MAYTVEGCAQADLPLGTPTCPFFLRNSLFYFARSSNPLPKAAPQILCVSRYGTQSSNLFKEAFVTTLPGRKHMLPCEDEKRASIQGGSRSSSVPLLRVLITSQDMGADLVPVHR